MRDLSRRLDRVSVRLTELNESSRQCDERISDEEMEYITINIVLETAKLEGLIPGDYESPVGKLAQEVLRRGKPLNTFYRQTMSQVEIRERMIRLKDVVCSHPETKAVWDRHIKDIPFPYPPVKEFKIPPNCLFEKTNGQC